MNAQELALQLNGRQYAEEITAEEVKQAKEAGLIVIHGSSDDLVEFSGAIDDEIGAYRGAQFLILKPGDEYPVDEEDETYKKAKRLEAVYIDESSQYKKNKVEARWVPDRIDELQPFFDFLTEIPHSTFNIYDGEELYCIGIVIDTKDLK